MRTNSISFFLLCLLFVVSFCKADEQTFEVVGIGECADCNENNFKTSDAFSGLHVTIDCKLKTGVTKRIGAGELDQQGEFKISLPKEIIQNEQNKLKEECYAQLHSSAAIPCPAHNGLESTKIIFKSLNNKKFTFTPQKTLQFSSALCTSKFLWPYFKYPPLPKTDSIWKKKFPKFNYPIPPVYKPNPPVYKPTPKLPPVKPVTPAVPIYKPKPKPPVYKPPVVKPVTPVVPIYKPNPKPPVYKPKPKPKPPVVKKPLLPPPIPLYPLPPFFHKKPCPPLPPFPKIPPKYFGHPKFGYFPPLPPSIPLP